MPPWNQMTPQQQAMLLQMMQAQFGGSGMSPQVGGAGAMPMVRPGVGQSPTMAQQMMGQGGTQFINPAMQQGTQFTNPLLNPQMGQAQQMNPQMLQ